MIYLVPLAKTKQRLGKNWTRGWGFKGEGERLRHTPRRAALKPRLRLRARRYGKLVPLVLDLEKQGGRVVGRWARK